MPARERAEHTHSHSHSLRGGGDELPPALRRLTFVLLALIAVATVAGLVMLWPDYAKVGQVAERASYMAPGASQQQGQVLSIEQGCEQPGASQQLADATLQQELEEANDSPFNACQTLGVGVLTGEDRGQLVEVVARGTLALSGLRVGDRVELVAFPKSALVAESESAQRSYGIVNTYEVTGIFRNLPIVILALLFVVVVVVVGRLRGLLALVALGVAAGVLLGFVLPALIAGGPALLIGLVGSVAIMFVTLYFVHGPNLRTTSALLGTMAGILIISAISWVSVRMTRLSGLGDESSGLLSNMVSEIDFRGLLTCSILIAGLGVLNDVTITQASSVWELRAAAPDMSRREIYSRAMRIGRDHIASTVYTVFFAYAGAGLSVLILLYLFDRPLLGMLTREDIAIEVVRTLAGSIGLVLAVPITTWVAAMFVPAPQEQPVASWVETPRGGGAEPHP